MADSQVNRGLLGMQRRTWGSLVALAVVLLLGVIFYFYPRTLEVRGASLGSTFTTDAQLIVKDKIDQTVVQVVPVSKVAVNMKSGYTISYSPSWFEFPRRLSVDVCFNRASVLPTTTTLPEHVYCQKPVEKVAYMCDDHNVWTQYFSTTQVADLRAYCGETKPSAAAPTTPVVAGDKDDVSDAPVTNYYTTNSNPTNNITNRVDMPECDQDEILVWDNNQWNCRDQATVTPTAVTYPSCAPGEVLTSVGGVLGCTPVAAAAYPNCAANETLTSTAGVLSCTPDYIWNVGANGGFAIPVTDGSTVKFTSNNSTIVTNTQPGNILNFNVAVDTLTPNNALVINGGLGLYVPAGLTSAITSINGQTGPAVTFDSTGPISTTTTANTVTYGLTACANGEVYQMVAGTWTCVSNGVVDADNGLSLLGNTVQLGGPVGAAGAAALLSNREIPTAGFDTAFSGTGRLAVGIDTIPAIGGAGPGNVFITSNSGNGTFYSARYENPGADDTGLKVFSNTNTIVARFGFYPGFAGNYALAVADQGDMMFGTNAAGGTTRFLAAGAERMFLSPQGNLSIGNNFTALAKLHLQGGTTGAAGTAGLLMEGVAAQPALSIANAGKVYFDSTLDKFRCSENTGAYFDCFNSSALTNANNGLSLSGTTVQLGGNLIQATNVTNNGFALGFVGSAQTNTYTSTGAAVFNGTTATAGKVATFVGDIDVTGTIDPTRVLFSNLAGVNSPTYNPSANANNYSMRFEEGGNLNFQSDTTNDILHLNNTGQVGIGISTGLTRRLTVQAGPGSSNNGIALLRAGGNPVVELVNSTVNGGQIDTYDAAGNPVTRLRNNASNFVVANDNANFGIGTTGPLNRLHVRQGVLGEFTAQIENYGNGANSNGLIVSAGGNVNTGSQMIEFRRPDGTVIGSVNQNTASTIAFNTTSDRRLKDHIVDTSLGLDTLMKLQVHDYNYISDANNTKMQGFIAQELNDVYSQAVTVGGANAKTNPWQVDYSKLTPLLTKSIQDLEVKKANKNEIADLNANDENFISELSGILDTTSAQKESIEKLLATLNDLKLDVAALQDTVKSIVAALDQDQFGQIKIKKGDTKGTVEFADKLTRTPVVNVTPHDFVSKGYAIKNITDRGFEIRLQEEQDEDVTFDWRAVAAREVEYNTSSTGGSTDSTPADDEESDGEEGTPVVEEEVTPTEETPVVVEEAPTTDEGGSDTGETPTEEPAIPTGI